MDMLSYRDSMYTLLDDSRIVLLYYNWMAFVIREGASVVANIHERFPQLSARESNCINSRLRGGRGGDDPVLVPH